VGEWQAPADSVAFAARPSSKKAGLERLVVGYAVAAKLKPCPICKAYYAPRSTIAQGCSPVCRLELKRQRELKAAKREERRQDREKLVKLRTRTDWAKLAQKEFNAYVRLRDADRTCISCGADSNHSVKWNAGHYRPGGINSALRFDESNCHKQCEKCNSWLSGNLSAYRSQLSARVGVAEVGRLDANHEVKRWSIPELIEIRNRYKAKLKELRASRGGL
jgi:hypothetical protein